MKRFLILFLIVQISFPHTVLAATVVGPDACRANVEDALSKEQRFFRAVLFGQKKPEDAVIGTVRYDSEGNPWRKTDDDEWKSVTEGFESTTWRDAGMESNQELPNRKGLYEQKGVKTSDLIPYISQSMRAFQCRVDTICLAAQLSLAVKGELPEDLDIEVPGCIPTTEKSLASCHLIEGKENIPSGLDLYAYCESIGNSLVGFEMDLIKAATEYDAAHRSLLQFSGIFDAFLIGWQKPLVGTLRQAVRLVRMFSRIPCFIGSCDTAPPPETE